MSQSPPQSPSGGQAQAVPLLTEAIDQGGRGAPRRVVFVPELVRRDTV